MKLVFTYERERDVWCLLNKGKSSHNSSQPTKEYSMLVTAVGAMPDEQSASAFVDGYLVERGIDPRAAADRFAAQWGEVSSEFEAIAERVFGVEVGYDIVVYLTINGRCPYSIDGKWFFVSLGEARRETTCVPTVMHELWHFFTWKRYGAEWHERLGAQRYNDIKESLTVLLNVECRHLFQNGASDKGYPQHKENREKVLRLWSESRDIDYVWSIMAA